MFTANRLLTASGLFHLHHLRAATHAEHKVLEEVYNRATEHADRLLEYILSTQPRVLDNVASLSATAGNAMSDLDAFINDLVDAMSHTSDDVLGNLLQDAVGEFKRLKYQLRLAQRK